MGLWGRADAHLRRLRRLALALFLKAYPLANSLAEGLTFCYQMLYLVDRSPYYSPMLHLLRQHIVRVSGQELVCTLHLFSVLHNPLFCNWYAVGISPSHPPPPYTVQQT